MNSATRFLIVDDTHPDIIYRGTWESGNASSLESQPDAPFKGSYHFLRATVTSSGNLSFAFKGSSIVAYGLHIPDNYSEPKKDFKCKVDGREITSFPGHHGQWNSIHRPLCGTDESLEDGQHVFDIVTAFPMKSGRSLIFDFLAYMPSETSSASDKGILFINHTDLEIKSSLSLNSWKLVPGLGYTAEGNISIFEMAFVGESLEYYGFFHANITKPGTHAAFIYWAVDGAPLTELTQPIPDYTSTSPQSDILFFRTEQYEHGRHTLLVNNTGGWGEPLTLSYIIVNGGSIAHSISIRPSSSISSALSTWPPTSIPNQSNPPMPVRQVPAIHIGRIVGSVLGGLFFSVVAALWLLRARQVRRRIRSDRTLPEPFEAKQPKPEAPAQGIIRFPFSTSPLIIPPTYKRTSRIDRTTNGENLPGEANHTSACPQIHELSSMEPVQDPQLSNRPDVVTQTGGEQNRGRVIVVHADSGVRLSATITQNVDVVELPPAYIP